MEHGSERTALQAELLGREGRELMAALGGSTLEDAARQARDLGMIMDAETRKATEDLNDEFSRLSLAWQKASQDIADGLRSVVQPAIAEVSAAVAGLGAGVRTMLDHLAEAASADPWGWLGAGQASIIEGVTLGLWDGVGAAMGWQAAINGAGESAAAAGESLDELLGTSRALATEWEVMGPTLEQAGITIETARERAQRLAQEQREAADAARRHANAQREAETAARALARAQDELRSVTADAADDLLSDEDRIQLAYEARIASIVSVTEHVKDQAALQAAADAAEERRKRDLSALEMRRAQESADAWRRSTEESLDAFQRMLDEMERAALELEEDIRRARQETLRQMYAAADQTMALMGGIASYAADIHRDNIQDIRQESLERTAATQQHLSEERERIDARLEAGEVSEHEHAAMLNRLKEETKTREKEDRKQRRQAHRAMVRGFKAQQRAQRSQAWIDAGRATLSLVPAFSWMGPLATGAAAALVGVQLKASLRQINRQNPPEFSGGGSVASRLRGTSPDHHIIQARADEGVVSPRGMARIGVDGLDALNRGGAVAAPTRLYLDGRVIAEAAERHGRAHLRPAPGRILGRVPVYGRG